MIVVSHRGNKLEMIILPQFRCSPNQVPRPIYVSKDTIAAG